LIPTNSAFVAAQTVLRRTGSHPFVDYTNCQKVGENGPPETRCAFAMDGWNRDLSSAQSLDDVMRIYEKSRYGYYTGKAWGNEGGQKGNRTLDLGTRYSLDRCSLAHDLHYWSVDESNRNDIDMLACMYKVAPSSAEERNALRMSYIGISTLALGLPPSSGPPDCVNGRQLDEGYLPPLGQPIATCR
jgi:hypothetical protein